MLTCSDEPCADNATCMPSSDGRSYSCQCASPPPGVVLGPDCYPVPQTFSTPPTSLYCLLTYLLTVDRFQPTVITARLILRVVCFSKN